MLSLVIILFCLSISSGSPRNDSFCEQALGLTDQVGKPTPPELIESLAIAYEAMAGASGGVVNRTTAASRAKWATLLNLHSRQYPLIKAQLRDYLDRKMRVGAGRATNLTVDPRHLREQSQWSEFADQERMKWDICLRSDFILDFLEAALQLECHLIEPHHLLKIKRLYLPNKSVDQLKKFDFFGMENLKSIHLEGNSISVLPEGLLDGLYNLEMVSFSENRISFIPEDFFSTNLKLFQVKFGSNSLANIPESLFQYNEQIHAIDFSGNQLTEIPKKLLVNQKNLRTLKLFSNKIKEIPQGLLKNLDDLRDLDLSGNLISAINRSLLPDKSNLQSLNLNCNAIKKIGPGVFADLPFIEEVYLASNQIEEFDPGNLYHLFNAEVLNLACNKLSASQKEALTKKRATMSSDLWLTLE